MRAKTKTSAPAERDTPAAPVAAVRDPAERGPRAQATPSAGSGMRHAVAHGGLWAVAGIAEAGAVSGPVGLLTAAGVAAGGAGVAYAVSRRRAAVARKAASAATGATSGGSGKRSTGAAGSRHGLIKRLAGHGRRDAATGTPGRRSGSGIPGTGTGRSKLSGLGRRRPGASAGTGTGRTTPAKRDGQSTSGTSKDKATKPSLLSRLLGRGKNSTSTSGGGGKGKSKGTRGSGSSGGGTSTTRPDKADGKKKGGGKSPWWRRLIAAANAVKRDKDKTIKSKDLRDRVVPEVPEAPELPKADKPAKDKPARDKPGKDKAPDGPKHTKTGGTPMGAISDAGDALMTAIGKADISTARNLEAALQDLTAFDNAAAQARQRLARRIADEFPADPGIADMMQRQATSTAKFATDGTEVQNALRKSHQGEWERLENPRTNENAWDHDKNNQA